MFIALASVSATFYNARSPMHAVQRLLLCGTYLSRPSCRVGSRGMVHPDPLQTLSTATVSTSCCHEMRRYRMREQSDPAYCLELFRRALHSHEDEAWERLLNGCVADHVRGKLHKHACWPLARKYQDEQFYLVESFARLWRSTLGQPPHLESLGGLFSLLHACLHSAILEELRVW